MADYATVLSKYQAEIAASRRDAERRRLSPFVGAPIALCGWRVRHMTLRDWCVLRYAGNAFLVGEKVPEPSDVIQFIHQILARPVVGHSIKRFFFMRSWRGLKNEARLRTACLAIREFLETQFSDSSTVVTGGRQMARQMPVSFAACMIDRMARTYGWTREETLNLSIPELHQYFNIADIRNDDAPLFDDEESAIEAQAFREYIAQKEAEEAAKDAAGV